jgi:16S rRNA (cytosine967-C5)-methyltransferase
MQTEIKLHRNICQAVIDSLHQIFDENKYADKVIEKTLKQNPKWGSRDRKFIAETVYEIVRWKRLLLAYIGKEEITQPQDYWTLFAAWIFDKNQTVPNWDELKDFNVEIFKKNKSDAHKKAKRAVIQSYPDWLDELLFQELGEIWDKECAFLNEPAQVVLRVNTLKTNKKQLIEQLTKEEVEVSVLEGYPDALIIHKRQNLFKTKAFQQGLFELQDASSQLIGHFLQLSPGMRLVDACAGGGGKSLHAAALMQNKGKIIAMDVAQWKLEELKKRAKRDGVDNIETKLIESKTIKRMANSADRLLLDVPCSGIGVIKRNPDAKWKLSPSFLDNVRKVQSEIIDEYSAMLKVGGLMVYATCSILPSENNLQVERFIKLKQGAFELIDQQAILPSSGFDGFFMALMKRVK